MVGEKENFGTVIIVVSAVCRSWTWHFSSFVSGWGYLTLFFTCLRGFVWSYLTSHLLIATSSWPLIHWRQILPTPLSCRRYVQEKLTFERNHLCLIVHKSYFTTLSLPVSCRWCGKHYGPPSTKITSCRPQLIIQESDLETPFRYLGACMPQWQVLRVRREVFIIGLRSDDSTGVRHQLIHSHAIDCTYSTLRTIVITGGTSRVC